MCGIYGILHLSGVGAPSDSARLAAMANVIVHRGPDDQGQLLDGPLAMGMRRLSIIDVDGGHQPISNEDETVWVVCNGEIYNFRELRADLKQQGHRFRTGSDAEVIVHLYEERGDDVAMHLRGMFGFALWDSKKQKLLLARDRLGIKPLYIRRDSKQIVFASELKAIIATGDSAERLDRVALREYLTLGYVPAPLSIIKGVEKLRQGSTLACQNGDVSIVEYWTPVAREESGISIEDWAAELKETLARSVERQLVSDVPVGAFLSGGLDSSSVVAMMAHCGAEPIRTYSIGFGGDAAGQFYNELPYARVVADQFGSLHKEIIVEPDIAGLLPKLLWHLDEPVADSALVTTYLVAEFASKDVKVILSGAGGDELFGGYRRYLGAYYNALLCRVPRSVRQNILVPMAGKLPADRHSALLNWLRYVKAIILSHEMSPNGRYKSYVSVFADNQVDELLRVPGNNHSTDILAGAFDGLATHDEVQQSMLVDLKTQLPDDILMLTDRMTMATSLECRVPLLDEAMVDLSLRMPASVKIRGRVLKHVLKESMKNVLPDQIIHRKKRGFGAPMGAWLKRELLPVTRHFLSPASVEARDYFHAGVVQDTISRHNSGAEDNTDKILALVNLEIWARMYLDGLSQADVTEEITEKLGR